MLGRPGLGGFEGATHADTVLGFHHLSFRLHLSMLVRPQAASQGILLSAAPMSGHSPSLVLFLNHGRFVAQTEGPEPRLQVQSRQHSRAGQWHRVRG